MTLPLTELQPYEAPVVSTEPHVGDYVTFLENWDFDGHYVQTYRATDGAIYAAVVAGDETRYVFQSGLSEDHSMFFFQDLFGYDGFFLPLSGCFIRFLRRGGKLLRERHRLPMFIVL